MLLSQRRADAIRDILINTFKISAKRLQSVGLGEEQLLDPARPNAPANNQVQIMTVESFPSRASRPPAGKPGACEKAGEEEVTQAPGRSGCDMKATRGRSIVCSNRCKTTSANLLARQRFV